MQNYYCTGSYGPSYSTMTSKKPNTNNNKTAERGPSQHYCIGSYGPS